MTGAQTPAKSPFPDVPNIAASARPDWTFLPHELQFYLGYFYDNVTHYHYCAVNDADNFFRSILTGLAMRDEALLYAVVGFSAYHHSMKNPNGKINEFLQYYSRSVTLLLECMKKEKYTVGTLLTILQLATIEVRDLASPECTNCLAMLTIEKGVLGRLGQFDGPSKSCLRGVYEAVHASDGNANACRACGSDMVRKVRCLPWYHGQFQNLVVSRVVHGTSGLL